MNALLQLSFMATSCQWLLFQVQLIVLFGQAIATTVFGADYYVASNGLDSNPGTVEQSFQTIGQAVRVMQAGDTCRIRGGVHRETTKLTYSGQKDKPITFARYQNEQVVVDGSDLVSVPWTVSDHGGWKAKIAGFEGEGLFDVQRLLPKGKARRGNYHSQCCSSVHRI